MRALSRLPDACGSSRVLSVSGRLITFARSHHACTHGLYECTMPALTHSTFADAGSTEPSGTRDGVSDTPEHSNHIYLPSSSLIGDTDTVAWLRAARTVYGLPLMEALRLQRLDYFL